MNEIERALATLQDLFDNSIFTSRIDFALEVAIEALREQAERNKGCGFCCYQEHPDKTFYPKEGYAFYAGFSKQIDVDAFDEIETDEIKYCPMCGKRLEVEHGE